VVAPFVPGPGSDLAFHRFVVGLVHSTIENNVLKLKGDEAYLFADNEPNFFFGNKMFIRPVYAPLAAGMDESLADYCTVMVMGTPGVGNTMMRNWYTKHVMTTPFGPNEQVRTIFLHSSDTPMYFMIKMERIPVDPALAVNAPVVDAEGSQVVPHVPIRVVVTASFGQNIINDREEASPTGMAYSLVNVESGGVCKDVDVPNRREDQLVLFASAYNSAHEKFRKYRLCAYYTPLWTLTELQEANAALELGLTVETIIDRYRKIGGIPQLVYARKQHQFDRYTNITLSQQALKMCRIDTIEQLCKTTRCRSAECLHSLAYYFVSFPSPDTADYPFADVEINWGTMFIAVEVVGKACDDLFTANIRSNDFYYYITGSSSIFSTMYKGWMIRKLVLEGLTGLRWKPTTAARGSRFTTTDFFGNGDKCTHSSFFHK